MSNQGERVEGFALAKQQKSGELAASAAAAQAKAEIEAAYAIAIHRPRNVENARTRILEACRRPKFAETARYIKPVGTRRIEGPSIRFAETAIQAFGNIHNSTRLIYEDDEKRILKVSLTDLETNLSYGKEITINKTVERRSLKQGQVAISQRENSTGQIVYLIPATEDDLNNKINAAESKIIRNSGLRLIPSDIIDEAMDLCIQTLNNGGEDKKARARKMADAFATLGIQPSDIEAYMGKPLAQATGMDFTSLTAIHNAIRDGEAKWADYAKKEPERGSVGLEDLSPGTPEAHTAPDARQTAPADPAAPAEEKPKAKRGRPKGAKSKSKQGKEDLSQPVNLLSQVPKAAQNDDRIQADPQTGEIQDEPDNLLADEASITGAAEAAQKTVAAADAPDEMTAEESARQDRKQAIENLQQDADKQNIDELRIRCNAAWVILDTVERVKAVQAFDCNTKDDMIKKLQKLGDYIDFLNIAHNSI